MNENNKKLRHEQHHVHHLESDQMRRRKQNAKILCEYLSRVGITPESVIDIGCGYGFFLEASIIKWNLKSYAGYDGLWIEQNKLLFPKQYFYGVDLKNDFEVNQKYDLCVTLEVAEHLEEIYAQDFIKKLTECSELILFSAAIPGQGGVGHKNEQHLDYWSRIFHSYGYQPVDVLHDYVWNDTRLFTWFRNNIILFSTEKNLEYYKHFRKHVIDGNELQRIHPKLNKNISQK